MRSLSFISITAAVIGLQGCLTVPALRAGSGTPPAPASARADASRPATASADLSPPGATRLAAAPMPAPSASVGAAAALEPLPAGITEFTGPPRWGVRARERKLALALPDSERLPLLRSNADSSMEVGPVARSGKQRVFVRRLVCVYGHGGAGGPTISFWRTPRPEVPPQTGPQMEQSGFMNPDVSAASCPPSWGDALRAAYGADFVAQALAQRRTDQAANDSTRAQRERQEQQARSRVEGWREGATVLPPAQERELALRLDAALRVATNGDAQAFEQAYNAKIEPDLLALARSGAARAAQIPAGEPGRAAFDAWDGGAGHAIVALTLRLRAEGRRTGLNLQLVQRIEADTIDIYRRQIGERGALEPRYAQSMLSALERQREADASGPAPTVQALRTESVLVMRPRESLMYRLVDNGVRALVGMVQAHAEAKRRVAELDRGVRQARQAFWQCYEARCPKGGELWHAYARMLEAKDGFMTYQYAMEALTERSGGNGSMMIAFLGIAQQVDGGPIAGCEVPYDRYLGSFGTFIASGQAANAAKLAQFVRERTYSQDYLQLQQCRDRMEFVRRPRGRAAN